MSLPLLVAIVVVGVAAIVIAVHLTGGSKPARLADEHEARRRFLTDFPDARIERTILTTDHDAALLSLGPKSVGVVQSLGGKFLTRLVRAEDLAGMPRAEGARLSARFRDFTWSGGTFGFHTEAEAQAAEAMLTRLRKANRWETT